MKNTVLIISIAIFQFFGQALFAQEKAGSHVSMDAYLVHVEEDVHELIVEVGIRNGWLIFVEVPADLPFQTAKLCVDLPLGVECLGDLEQENVQIIDNDSDVLMSGFGIIFKQKIKCNELPDEGQISCKMIYQACNRVIYTPVIMDETYIDL